MNDAEKLFFRAVESGDRQVVERMLASSPHLAYARDSRDKTALHWAAEKDFPEIARMLIEAGADVEAKTDWGATPLDWAATMGSRKVADLLLPLSSQPMDLITAASLGRLKEVERFLEAGESDALRPRRAAPNHPTDHWVPGSAQILGDIVSDAFYSACRNGHTEVAACLMSRGARIDAKGVFGGTGLHWAAHNGHRDTVEFLVEKGAALESKDEKFDALPEDWAGEGGFKDLANFLREKRLRTAARENES